METFSFPSIGMYCLFCTFVSYQILHAQHFRGASQAFLGILSISGLLGVLTGLVFLIYYGWHTTWWAPLVVFAIGFFSFSFSVFMERLLGAFTISLLGFIGWPVCAYYMFKFVPRALGPPG
ncbi:MAG: hypothetical protein KBF21_19585 [Thermoanaerobaculia bacterium]|nr:hypothetical protein [Thermoanaerobaculia bacterium]